ncbi:MAG: hypothetical protein ACR2NH_12915 [Solirubrobacteraceae bacterium]
MRRFALIATCCCLALAPSAWADESSVQGYSGEAGSVLSQVPPEPAGESADGGSLPFTGLDVGFMLALGAGLVAAGFGLNLLLRRRPAPSRAIAGAGPRRADALPPPPVADLEAARIVALEMLIDGNSRQEVAVYLERAFRISDPEAVIADSFGAPDRGRSGMAIDVGRRVGRRTPG